jgi:hypothetical protein
MQLLCQGIDDAGTQAALAKAEVALGVPVPLSRLKASSPYRQSRRRQSDRLAFVAWNPRIAFTWV